MILRRAGPAEAPAIARVQVDTWRSTYRGLVPDDFLAAMSPEKSAEGWRRALLRAAQAERAGREFALVAEDPPGEVVGFCTGGPERDADPPRRGEVYAIYVLASHQGKGIGRRLMMAAAAKLELAALPSLVVWVLKQNDLACRFYAALGGEPAGRRVKPIGGVPLEEVLYEWTDLSRLAHAPVVIADHDPRWAARFAEERQRIAGALGAFALGVEHIGSTAVPGLAAKPILDLLVGVRPMPPGPEPIAALGRLGYDHLGEHGIPGRHFFARGWPRTHHLHLVEHGGAFWTSHLRFRDHLRAHPEEARAYAALKRELAARYRRDRFRYTEMKSAFIAAALARAGALPS